MLNMLLANTVYPFSNPFHRRTHRQKYFLIYSLFFHPLALVLCTYKNNEIRVGVKRMDVKLHPAQAFSEYLPDVKPDYSKAGLPT